jgi:metal-responsive CopG/Arc/MetJ family transcriptional regulator
MLLETLEITEAMAKKKRAKTATERVRAHRKRQANSGKMQINVSLQRSAVKELDSLCKSTDQSRGVVIEQLIRNRDGVSVDGLKARGKTASIHKKARRFREFMTLMDDPNKRMTKKQLEELQEISLQIAMVATNS